MVRRTGVSPHRSIKSMREMVVHGGRIHTDHDRRLPHTHTRVHRNSTGDNNGPQNTLCSAISTGFGTRRLLLLLLLLLRSWQHQAHSLSTNDGTSINPVSHQTHRLPVHEVVTDAVPVLDPIWLPASIPFGHIRMYVHKSFLCLFFFYAFVVALFHHPQYTDESLEL